MASRSFGGTYLARRARVKTSGVVILMMLISMMVVMGRCDMLL